MDFLTLIVRARDEPFLGEFLHYYLSEGVSRIYVLDDNSTYPISISAQLKDRVGLFKARRMANDELADANELYAVIRKESYWFALLDADEFVTTRRNPKQTVTDCLRSTFSGVDCVKVPWVMMASGGRENDPQSLLLENVHRWNHDSRHPHPHNWHKGRCRYEAIEVKSFFRGNAFASIGSPHHPAESINNIRCVDSIRGAKAELDPFHANLRERDIMDGHLLCYHYRFASRQSYARKRCTSCFPSYGVSDEVFMASDHADLVDETLKKKWQSRLSSSCTPD